MDLVERLKRADSLLRAYFREAREIGRILAEVLTEALGFEVSYRIGDETGRDSIWLTCSLEEFTRRKYEYPLGKGGNTTLFPAIRDAFPELAEAKVYIDSLIHITPEEYEKAYMALRKLRGGEV